MSKFFDQYSSIIEASLQQVRLRVDPHNKCADDFAQYDGYIGFILAETDKSVDFYSNNTIITIPRKGFIFEGVLTGLAGTAPAGDTSKRTAVGSMARQAIGTAARIGSAVYGVNLPAGQKAPQAAEKTPAPGSGMKLPASFDRSIGFKLIDRSGIATLNANGVSYGFTKIALSNGSGLVIVPESFEQLLGFFSEALALPPSSSVTPQAPLINTSVIPPTRNTNNTTPPATSPPTINVNGQQIVDFIKTNQIASNPAILSKQVDIMMSNIDPKAQNQTPIVHTGVFTKLPSAADIIFTFLD